MHYRVVSDEPYVSMPLIHRKDFKKISDVTGG